MSKQKSTDKNSIKASMAGVQKIGTPTPDNAQTKPIQVKEDSPRVSQIVQVTTSAQDRLATLEAHLQKCKACPLAQGRTNIVFGAGNPSARVVIIGEAPGKNEDAQGLPFVGAAGKYLNELLAQAGLERQDIYIANVLKCRPPSNRNPKPEEILACADNLRAQVSIIKPEIVVTLGNFATRFILKTDTGITSLRGKLVDLGSFKVLPVFHPAAAIYDRTKRDYLAADFAYLGQLLGYNQKSQGCSEGV